MKRLAFLSAFLLLSWLASGQIRLPRLVSDGVVLQRDKKIKLWGWASPGESVQLQGLGKTYAAAADEHSRWSIELPQQTGGPFTLEFKGHNTVTINNVMFGDVWICSGQSNMELPMTRVKDKYPKVIEQCENSNIRQFLVPDKYDFKKEHDDLDDGSWKTASPKNILDFSAVGYFFAKELYEKHHVPIGLINAALGGSPVEAWMSEDALSDFPDLFQEIQRFKDDKLNEETENSDQRRASQWYHELNSKDGGVAKWMQTSLPDLDWQDVTVPGPLDDDKIGNANGSVWFRKKINIPRSMTGKPGKIWLGRIVDADSVFINEKFIGTTGYQYPPRKYEFGADVLREGENIIAVKLISVLGKGGFVLDKPYFLAAGGDTLDLKGAWKAKRGATLHPLEESTAIRWKPSGLYKKMISPLLPFSMKGVIWYQGESNTRNPKQYESLFPALINNWRTKWTQGDFPFLFVQLANFMEPSLEPSESQWAELREAQRKALSIPNTGMAVAIDIGEWNDVHPLNKREVGKRLALLAEHFAYSNNESEYSGPLYQSHKVKGNKLIVTFSNIGGGLVSKGDLKCFAIAGPDKKFVWATAQIKGNTVVVWSEKIKHPAAIRYAWADNPVGANLYNRAGLPASPFKTD